MRSLRQLAAVVILPGTVCVLVPALLLDDTDLAPWPLALLGAVLTALGGAVIAWTVSELVVRGPYRHVRNPMISGVIAVLLGEAALFGSLALLAWAVVVFAINAVYFPLVEEPDLRRRFGAAYDEYAARTPRWLPR